MPPVTSAMRAGRTRPMREGGDLRGRIPQEVAKQGVGVLTEPGRRRRLPDRALGLDGRPDLADPPELWMVYLDDHVSSPDLLVLERLSHAVDRGARHAASQPCKPRRCRQLAEAGLEDRQQLRLVDQTIAEGGEAWIRPEMPKIHRVDQRGPEFLLGAEHHDPAVACLEVLRRNEALVPRVLHALGLPVAVERPRPEVRQHAHGRIEQRHIEVSATTGALRVPQSDHQREHRRIAPSEIDDRHAALAGRPVGLAGDRHVPGMALDQIVVAGLGGSRARRPEPRERAAHDGGIDDAQRLVREAELVGQVTAHVVVHAVRHAHEVVEDRSPLGVRQIERDGFLAAIEGLKVERIALDLPRRYVARDVASDRWILDLDDLGAEVGEHLCAERPGAELRNRQNAQAVERSATHTETAATSRAASSARAVASGVATKRAASR